MVSDLYFDERCKSKWYWELEDFISREGSDQGNNLGRNVTSANISCICDMIRMIRVIRLNVVVPPCARLHQPPLM